VWQRRIDLDNTMAQLNIDDNPPSLSDEEKQATVRMLLEPRSGVYHPALYETRAMTAKRPARFSHALGTFWYYNNWDFNVLGAIYEKATGRSIYQAFANEIARPIGMQDYDPMAQHYVLGAASIHPAYTFRMSARDLAHALPQRSACRVEPNVSQAAHCPGAGDPSPERVARAGAR